MQKKIDEMVLAFFIICRHWLESKEQHHLLGRGFNSPLLTLRGTSQAHYINLQFSSNAPSTSLLLLCTTPANLRHLGMLISWITLQG
jgi:hypothetical protein